MLMSGWNIQNGFAPIHIVSLVLFVSFLLIASFVLIYYTIYIKMIKQIDQTIAEAEVILKMNFYVNVEKMIYISSFQTDRIDKENYLELISSEVNNFSKNIANIFQQDMKELQKFISSKNNKFPSFKKYRSIKKNAISIQSVHASLISMDIKLYQFFALERDLKKNRISTIDQLNTLFAQNKILVTSIGSYDKIDIGKVDSKLKELSQTMYEKFALINTLIKQGNYQQAFDEQLSLNIKIIRTIDFFNKTVMYLDVIKYEFENKISEISQRLNNAHLATETKAFFKNNFEILLKDYEVILLKFQRKIEKFNVNQNLSNDIFLLDKKIADFKVNINFEIEVNEFIENSQIMNEQMFKSFDNLINSSQEMLEESRDLSKVLEFKKEIKNIKIECDNIKTKIDYFFKTVKEQYLKEGVDIIDLKSKIESNYKILNQIEKRLLKIISSLKPNFDLKKQLSNDLNLLNSLISNNGILLYKNEKLLNHDSFLKENILLKTEITNFNSQDIVRKEFISNDKVQLETIKTELNKILTETAWLNGKIKTEIAIKDFANLAFGFFSTFSDQLNFEYEYENIEKLLNERNYESVIKKIITVIEEYKNND